MKRTTFYYTINNVNYIFAVKHCIRPKQTKVYKDLKILLGIYEVEAIGYTLGTINY
jgi:hypothetical protein